MRETIYVILGGQSLSDFLVGMARWLLRDSILCGGAVFRADVSITMHLKANHAILLR